MTLNYIGEAPILEILGIVFIDITPRYALIQSGNTYEDSIRGSNKSIWKLFVLDRNTSYITVCERLQKL